MPSHRLALPLFLFLKQHLLRYVVIKRHIRQSVETEGSLCPNSTYELGRRYVRTPEYARLLTRLLPKGEYLSYELIDQDGEPWSACARLVDQNEELVPAWRAILASGSVRTQDTPPDELLGRELLEAYSSSLTRMAVAGARQPLPKISVIAHLALDQDVHPTNMGIIRSISTGAIHIAPFFTLIAPSPSLNLPR